MIDMQPDFADDSTEMEYDLDSEVKGAVKWEENEDEYVFLWYQDPFYKLKGFSMSESLLEDIPDHIETVWCLSNREGELFKFSVEQFEDAEAVERDADVFNNYDPGERQFPVGWDEAEVRIDIPEELRGAIPK